MSLKHAAGIFSLLISGSTVEAEIGGGGNFTQSTEQASGMPQSSSASMSARKPGERLPVRFKWDWRDAQFETFRGLPRDIRLLLQQNVKERTLCRGGSGGNRSTLRACNRWALVDVQLMKLGWCFGGSGGEAFRSWMRCDDDPSFRPEALREEAEPYFSEEDIAEAFEDEPEVAAPSREN